MRERVAEGAQPREPLGYFRPLAARLLAGVKGDRLANCLKEVASELRIPFGDRGCEVEVTAWLRLGHTGAV